jgi:hypothetical protein
MSLDIYLETPVCSHCKRGGETLWTGNITHNLGKMARAVPFENAPAVPATQPDLNAFNLCFATPPEGIEAATLYQVLWRPEELDLKVAFQIVPWLEKGLAYLESHVRELRKFDPENGWGSYEHLCEFTRRYLTACREHPEATIRVWR